MSDGAVRTGTVTFMYKNHRDEESMRKVQPVQGSLRYGTLDHYYTESQWLFDAFDLDKGALRTFSCQRMLTPFQVVGE